MTFASILYIGIVIEGNGTPHTALQSHELALQLEVEAQTLNSTVSIISAEVLRFCQLSFVLRADLCTTVVLTASGSGSVIQGKHLCQHDQSFKIGTVSAYLGKPEVKRYIASSDVFASYSAKRACSQKGAITAVLLYTQLYTQWHQHFSQAFLTEVTGIEQHYATLRSHLHHFEVPSKEPSQGRGKKTLPP